MSPRSLVASAALAVVVLASSAIGQVALPVSEPGDPAPAEVAAELQREVAVALQRFERMDVVGILDGVSDRYRSGLLTKPLIREQLVAMFTAHESVRARVRIDDIRMIGDRAWIYSTGEVTGRLRFIGTPVSLFAWDRAPEVAWREGGRWRLIGDQQG